MLNILVPMAGAGSRFKNAGFTLPKPLIPVKGAPMIQRVIDNITPKREHKFIFLCLQSHIVEHNIDSVLAAANTQCEIISVDSVTEGAACTALLAESFIDNDQPLMIANSDQYVESDIDDYLTHMDENDLDGLIMTMTSDHPKWSYVRFGDTGEITEVVEKEVVSNEATVGIYNYRKGSYFVDAAKAMIEKNIRVNNEFYVAPAYNQMIAGGLKLGCYSIGSEYEKMHGLGTPEDLEAFLAKSVL